MMKMPVQKGCIWVDLGGGTASNVEFFSKSVMTDWFNKVYVVDLTPSLVKVAKKRVEDNKWVGKVNPRETRGLDRKGIEGKPNGNDKLKRTCANSLSLSLSLSLLSSFLF